MKASRDGFTIVELLIVIVVIGILAAITIVAFNGVQNRANDTAVQSDLANLKKKFELYNAEYGQYPHQDTEIATAASPFKAAKGSYAIAPTTNHNLIFCREPSNPAKYGVAAYSKSGNKYYISNTQGVTSFTNAWTNQTTVCAALDAAYTSNFRGYAGDDLVTGPWRAWAGGN